MACKVLLFIVAGLLLVTALAAPADVSETKDLVPENDDLQTAASHWGGHYGGWGGHYGGWGHYGGFGGYGYPHYGYWGWPSYSWYGHGYPYGHGGYWW